MQRQEMIIMTLLNQFLFIENRFLWMENCKSHHLLTFNVLAADALSVKQLFLKCIYSLMTTIVLIVANGLIGSQHRKSMRGGLNDAKSDVGQ